MTKRKSRHRQKTHLSRGHHSKRRVLFYAGMKADGTPRAWTLAEFLFTSLCGVLILTTAIGMIQWLLEFDFGFGK